MRTETSPLAFSRQIFRSCGAKLVIEHAAAPAPIASLRTVLI
jgi:hypothetical protein